MPSVFQELCHHSVKNLAEPKATSFQWSCQGTICCPVKSISVGGGYSDTAPASQAEQMHQNADSKEPDEQILETSLQSEAEPDDDQTTTTSVPTLNRSNTFTCSYSKKSEE